MRLDAAAARLAYALVTCSPERAAALNTLLGIVPAGDGTGQDARCVSFRCGSRCSVFRAGQAPVGLSPERRAAWCLLLDALRCHAVGVLGAWDPAARIAGPPRPPRQKEKVIALLVSSPVETERGWFTIERMARLDRARPRPIVGAEAGSPEGVGAFLGTELIADQAPLLLTATGLLVARDLFITPETGMHTALTDDQVTTLVELARADRRADYDTLCGALGVRNGRALWVGIRRQLDGRARRQA